MIAKKSIITAFQSACIPYLGEHVEKLNGTSTIFKSCDFSLSKNKTYSHRTQCWVFHGNSDNVIIFVNSKNFVRIVQGDDDFTYIELELFNPSELTDLLSFYKNSNDPDEEDGDFLSLPTQNQTVLSNMIESVVFDTLPTIVPPTCLIYQNNLPIDYFLLKDQIEMGVSVSFLFIEMRKDNSQIFINNYFQSVNGKMALVKLFKSDRAELAISNFF